jgi:hypothetical protein
VTIAYKAVNGASVQLRPFVGRNIALLIDPAGDTNRVVIDRILAAFDRAWDWYCDYFGRVPRSRARRPARTIAVCSGTRRCRSIEARAARDFAILCLYTSRYCV